MRLAKVNRMENARRARHDVKEAEQVVQEEMWKVDGGPTRGRTWDHPVMSRGL